MLSWRQETKLVANYTLSKETLSSTSKYNNGRGIQTALMLVVAFIVGASFGHLHCRLFHCTTTSTSFISTKTSARSDGGPQLSLSKSPTTTIPTCMEQEMDGWHVIRVFVGDIRKHLLPQLDIFRAQIKDGTRAPKSSISLDSEDRMWFAQAKQDEFIWALLRHKTNGYFIDLAANDAMELSNTLGLEVQAQWRGLCIEPNPMYWYNLTYYRTCQVVAAVVGKTRMEPVLFHFDGAFMGGIVGDQFDNSKEERANSSHVQYTVPLLEVLQYHQVPQVIDYLSLDVEGAEGFILESFPFDQYNISILSVERPKRDVQNLLQQNGYQFLKQLSKWGETLWAHESIWSQLDLTILNNFTERQSRGRWKFPDGE